MKNSPWGLIPLPLRTHQFEKVDTPIEDHPSGDACGCSSFDSSQLKRKGVLVATAKTSTRTTIWQHRWSLIGRGTGTSLLVFQNITTKQ